VAVADGAAEADADAAKSINISSRGATSLRTIGMASSFNEELLPL
jgi:hypothetical protein